MAENKGKMEDVDLTFSTDVPPDSEVFSLEEILAEYGGSREQKILESVEREVRQQEQTSASPPKENAPAAEKAEHHTAPRAPEPPREEPPLLREEAVPPPPRPISLGEVVGSTVDAVMEERQEKLLRPRRGLFSRRKMEETEQLYTPPPPPEEPEKEPIGPEPPLSEAAAEGRTLMKRGRAPLPAAFFLALVPALIMAAEHRGLSIPLWTGDDTLQWGVLLAVLLGEMVLCRAVAARGVKLLCRGRCSGEVMIFLAAAVCAVDCLSRLLGGGQTQAPPYAAVAAMGLAFAQWGLARGRRGDYEMLRTAALDDEPPYLVTETEGGACKQPGHVEGFYTAAQRENDAVRAQAVVLPMVAVASLVFAVLTSFGQGRGGDFWINWSALLTAGAGFTLPLCWALPWSKVSARLQKAGCAVAGWDGAERISREKKMILTDRDLFPPGTISLNGVKVYGEEVRVAASYAAALTRAAESGLDRLFEGLALSENGRKETAEDFSFYKEGGYSGTIRGQTVLMGTASFMRKMGVRLPSGINLKTGIFLSVDKEMAAVFAVKYNPAENVDYALRMMRRSHVTPVLAARDPNITPALLTRKFHKGVRVEYPDLTERVALSEAGSDRGMPRALLLREGLLPYAEAVVGSRRLCAAVRRCTGLSLLGSVAGTLLGAYLVSLGAYELLTPLSLECFLLLWTLPVLLLSQRSALC